VAVTIHYHGTPITPLTALYSMSGGHFCVSHWRPDQTEQCHKMAQSVMLDNGAFSAWQAGRPIEDWRPYYDWCDRWLGYPTTWAVIPDIITGTVEDQDALLKEWPFGHRGAPVWHMHEPIDRLLWLVDHWPKVCMGSSAEYAVVLSKDWERRMDAAWRALDARNCRTPWVHMLRGMQLVRGRWPFASVDSTSIARNHPGNNTRGTPAKSPEAMMRRWDRRQCPPKFYDRGGEQLELIA
jgi:hypothetical protein